MSGALPKLIAVVGTNASGKSSLAISLARSLGGEVISADSRQVYRGLDLGSGKVTAQEMQGVPHHLLDVCDPGTFFTMADFQRLAYRAIDDVLARGRVPVLAGGTGLYVDAVCDGYVLSNIEPDLSYRRELERLPTPQLCAMLQAAAPGNAIDPQNRNRVMRALEKLHDGDTLPAQKRPRYDVLRLGVTWDRPTLCARIDERLARRVQQGMIEEVDGLLQAGVHLVEGAGAEAVLAGQPLRLFQRAVRHHGHRHVLRHEVLHGQLAHLARAQDEHPLVRDAAQLPRGQLHGNAPDGGGVAADARLGAHLLAQRQRALEPHVDHLVVCPRLAGGPVGTRHLAGYLRLAHDERV